MVLAALAAARGLESEAIARLREFIAIPSISGQLQYRDEVVRAAEWLRSEMAAAGVENSKVVPTEGHPIVVGEWRHAPAGAPTVLVYCHYDVQPVDPVSEWDHDPFAAKIDGDRLIGRGSADDKGPILEHLTAFRALLSTDSLPVNLVFCFEGEEESGSPNLSTYLHEHKDDLGVDLVVASDTTMLGLDRPGPVVSMRGLAALEVRVENATHDVHSGKFGGAIANPATVLCRMLAEMHDEQGRVAVPGFYDDVVEPSAAVRRATADLGLTDFDWIRPSGASVPSGESGWTTLERVWLRPTLDVNGLVSGYAGEGSKTIVPASASAKISCRLVAGQHPDTITELVARRLTELAPQTVRVTVTPQHGGEPVQIASDHPAVQVALEAYSAGYGRPASLAREGGSVPVVKSLQDILGVEAVLLGFGIPEQSEHAPNEWLSLENFGLATATIIHFWNLLGRVPIGQLSPVALATTSTVPQSIPLGRSTI